MIDVYQPKGGLCFNCVNKRDDCSHLPFKNWPVIEQVGNVKIVYCKAYKKNETKD